MKRPLSPTHAFLTLGGHSVLDFCNTRATHGETVEDRLDSEKATKDFLFSSFKYQGALTHKDSAQIKDFRELIRDYLEDHVAKTSRNRSQDKLNAFLAKLPFCFRVDARSKPSVAQRLTSSVSQAFEPIVLGLFDLLTVRNPQRIKRCANPNCSHLFLDTSKSGTRNWCSMLSCGNIMKARAFYSRQRKGRVAKTRANSKG